MKWGEIKKQEEKKEEKGEGEILSYAKKERDKKRENENRKEEAK